MGAALVHPEAVPAVLLPRPGRRLSYGCTYSTQAAVHSICLPAASQIHNRLTALGSLDVLEVSLCPLYSLYNIGRLRLVSYRSPLPGPET